MTKSWPRILMLSILIPCFITFATSARSANACIGLIGDVNGDTIVDVRDLYAIALAFGSTLSSPSWNPNADVNWDGRIDIIDAYIIAAHFGQAYMKTDPIPVSLEICPQTLNLRSRGRWVTGYIRFEGQELHRIKSSSVFLNGTIPAEKVINIQNCNNDTITVVKFSRQAVIDLILNSQKLSCHFTRVTLTVTGELFGGETFEGSDTIRILS